MLVIAMYILRTDTPARRLSLYFPKEYIPQILSGKKKPIVLDFGQGFSWRGTMNSVSPNNRPWVHDSLTSALSGERRKCTDVLDSLGLTEGTHLQFELTDLNHFRLIQWGTPA